MRRKWLACCLAMVIGLCGSSAFGQQKRPWGPEQAAGKPDTMTAGDHKTAWAPSEPQKGEQWLYVRFKDAVEPAQLRVRETFNPGAVSKVTAFDEANREQLVWEGEDTNRECPGFCEVDVAAFAGKVNRIKIYFDTDRVPGWNEIDAIELVAKSGQRQWAQSAMASTSFAQHLRVPEESRRPRVVRTRPKIGASNVAPSLREISVTFSKDMGAGFSWTGGGDIVPKITGRPVWETKRTCVAPANLEPGRFYRVGINTGSEKSSNFRSTTGTPAETWAIWFTTKGASANLVKLLKQPQVESSVPGIGDKAADPAITEIKITFDQPMGPDISLVGGGPLFPKGTAPHKWDKTKRTLTWPAKLDPGREYRFYLNSARWKGFSNVCGVPLSPVTFYFRTRK